MNITFVEKQIYNVEGGIDLVEGSTTTITCTYWNTPSTVSAAVYRNGTAVTSTVMPSGSVAISGYGVALKPLTALVGGAKYVIAVIATVGGDVTIKKAEITCGRDEDER